MKTPKKLTIYLSKIIGILTILVLFSSQKCSDTSKKTTPTANEISFSIDPTANYDSQWKVVDSLNNLGLYKTSLNVVTAIYEKSKAANHHSQTIKSLIYKIKINSSIKDDDFVAAVYELDSITQKAAFPLKNIAHALIADIIWGYYQANEWEMYDRTHVVDFEMKDIRTWDLRSLGQCIIYHRMHSTNNAQMLQQIPLTQFADILKYNGKNLDTSLDTNFDKLTPTLYDFLAYESLSFFNTSSYNISQNSDKFLLNEPKLFADNNTFISLDFQKKDSLDNHYYALQLFKELTRAHLYDDDPTVLIDIITKRLDFIYTNGVFDNKNKLYIEALQNFNKAYIKNQEGTQFQFLMAQYHVSTSDDKETENNGNVLAIELCNDAIKRFPKSFGAQQCEVLKQLIERKTIEIDAEKYTSNKMVQRIKITYKNIPKVYFQILKLPYDYENGEYISEKKIADYIKHGKFIKTWEKELPNLNDYITHSIETLIDPLEYGYYVILAGSNPAFSTIDEGVAVSTFTITDFTYEEMQVSDKQIDIGVYNRASGNPIVGVKVTLYKKVWNTIKRKYDNQKVTQLITDKNGKISYQNSASISKNYNNETYYCILEKNNDYLNSDKPFTMYDNYNEYEYTKTHFFIDRKIYRPGQPIYFKGIVTKKVNGAQQTLANQNITVEFLDVNYQLISKQEVRTNKYGSYSGQFIAPIGTLTGVMTIQDNFGSVNFNVEEYKRPKFEVTFNPIIDAYKLNESLTIKGNARAFAGNAIDGALVSYRVIRSARFPYWCYYRYGHMPNSNQLEITNGSTITKEDGSFEITFVAKNDAEVNTKYAPIYTYEIIADVIDINGETLTGTTSIDIANQALELAIIVPSQVELSAFNHVIITTKNLNYQPIAAIGNLSISKLKTPSKALVPRTWSAPDIKDISKETFEMHFPYEVFDNENFIQNFPIEKIIIDNSFDNSISDTFKINTKKFEAGTYKIEAQCKDKFGYDISDIKYITLIDSKSKTAASHDFMFVNSNQKSFEPGEIAKITIASKSDILVNYVLAFEGKILKNETIKISNEQKTITIPILEQHRGGLVCHFSTFKHGKYFSKKQLINVPFSNKELKLTFETFRNKLLPGADETWRIKLTGNKSEKVAAEMVAAMYDASLDAFASNFFDMYLDYGKRFSSYPSFSAPIIGFSRSRLYAQNWNLSSYFPAKSYPKLNWFGFNIYRYNQYYDAYPASAYEAYDMNVGSVERSELASIPQKNADEIQSFAQGGLKTAFAFSKSVTDSLSVGYKKSETLNQPQINDLNDVKTRSNFNETAFFFPNLETNEKGEIIFSFTLPESLTKWKFLGFAHTQDLKKGVITENVLAQKDLMVVPNAPRFLRENDQIILSSKITNMTNKSMIGSVKLVLLDPFTNKNIDYLLKNTSPQNSFNVAANQSCEVNWTLNVPIGLQAISYKIVAQSGAFSDGEEMTLPVLTNRMLVTETLPLYINKKGSKNFTFNKLLTNASKTLTHQSLTLEFTSNPAWYAIQSLPYLMEFPHECAEQTFARYYANAIAAHIAQSNPKINAVFDTWSKEGKSAFISNLDKNQELKALFLEETPWVLQSQSEAESKKRVGLLFDVLKMSQEMDKSLHKLEQIQSKNGGWSWFPGFKENRYITQHIISGMGHLKKMGIIHKDSKKVTMMLQKGIAFLDYEILRDFNDLTKNNHSTNFNNNHLNTLQIQYLYARSFFDIAIDNKTKPAFDFYIAQSKKYWLQYPLQTKAMIALYLHRFNDSDKTKTDIIKHLSELAITTEEMGCYFKDNISGYYWENAQIETQSLIIEAFDEVANDFDKVEELKTWLLKQKQTTHWKTTKATAMACYVLMMRGTNLLENDEIVGISLGALKINPTQSQAGTGYFKTSWSKENITNEMANVTLTKKTDGASWGALYWQYFEDLDKITTHNTSLKITKKLFKVNVGANGESMVAINEKNTLKKGDKVRVRIELFTDRNLEYVHIKDMRAAGFEPINVLSGYKYKHGLGYYEASKDASTHFFIDFLSKGTYVFEYDLRVFHQGDFSNGIASIQCMYAPEFTSHSEGIRVSVLE